MPAYMLTSSDGRGHCVPLTASSVRIGRTDDNSLSLPDDERVSRQHCVIELDSDGHPIIRDLGSTNGTKVNSQRISGPVGLRAGDHVKVGNHTFIVEAEQSLGEARDAARARTIDSDMPWRDELAAMVEALPPKGESALEQIILVDGLGKPTGTLDAKSDGPNALRLLLHLAAKARATDIHVELKLDRASVRMRVDGQMVPIADLPRKAADLLQGVVRAACQMATAARDAAQDGHFSARFRQRRVDYRVSLTPSVFGPKLVLRVLDPTNAPRSLLDLGLASYMFDRVRKSCEKEAGLLLVCGPTGSGKTTTLYNALREIDRETSNVVTIEDPVEYQLEGVTQIPVDEHKGNSFSGLLRSVLRQDPDVILVGEIRDEETARTAMQAALTGHLVFSTVHAKDSITSVFRLLDLKVEPYLVANSLDLVLAQRLVRTLCDNCKQSRRVTPGQATRIGKYLEGKHETFEPVGCAACLRTGFRGRKAVFELLDVTDELRDVVLHEPSIQAMKKVIEKGLFTTLLQSAWVMAARGMTSLDEAERLASGG